MVDRELNLPQGDFGQDCLEKVEKFLFESSDRFYLDDTCREELQLVKLWLEYAAQVQDPVAVFEFMRKRQIGVKSANVAIHWAFHLEKHHRRFDKVA